MRPFHTAAISSSLLNHVIAIADEILQKVEHLGFDRNRSIAPPQFPAVRRQKLNSLENL